MAVEVATEVIKDGKKRKLHLWKTQGDYHDSDQQT